MGPARREPTEQRKKTNHKHSSVRGIDDYEETTQPAPHRAACSSQATRRMKVSVRGDSSRWKEERTSKTTEKRNERLKQHPGGCSLCVCLPTTPTLLPLSVLLSSLQRPSGKFAMKASTLKHYFYYNCGDFNTTTATTTTSSTGVQVYLRSCRSPHLPSARVELRTILKYDTLLLLLLRERTSGRVVSEPKSTSTTRHRPTRRHHHTGAASWSCGSAGLRPKWHLDVPPQKQGQEKPNIPREKSET